MRRAAEEVVAQQLSQRSTEQPVARAGKEISAMLFCAGVVMLLSQCR